MSIRAAAAVISDVKRKQQFQKEHGDVDIQFLKEPVYHWQARWTDAAGNDYTLVQHELGLLMDELEEMVLADAVMRHRQEREQQNETHPASGLSRGVQR